MPDRVAVGHCMRGWGEEGSASGARLPSRDTSAGRKRMGARVPERVFPVVEKSRPLVGGIAALRRTIFRIGPEPLAVIAGSWPIRGCCIGIRNA